MAIEIKEYSSRDVVMTFGGIVVEGWDRIVVTKSQASFRLVEGIRGKNTRVRVLNTAARIEITLTQTSDTNYIFSEIVKLDEIYGTGRIDLQIKDILTGETFKSQEAFLEKPADMEWTEDISERVWVMHCLTSNSESATEGSLGSLVDKIAGMFS